MKHFKGSYDISEADDDIETSLNEGLALLEAEFNDVENQEALAALRALAIKDFASLKLDQIYYPPHHHHVHGPGKIPDSLNCALQISSAHLSQLHP